MAGTGGTSSSSPAAELCTFLGFGVGKRDVDKTGLDRIGPLDWASFSEFKLEFDDSDMPDVYDLRFCSGVSRADDGVMLLLYMTAGDWLKARSSKDWSPCGVGGPFGPLGGLGFIDNRLSLRASVGLIVLAPRPEICGAVDCRLLDEEEGVCVRWAGDLPGERKGMEAGSGVMDETAKCPGCSLDGGWKDFAFAVRVAALGNLGTPVAEFRLELSGSRRMPLFNEGERPMPVEAGASPPPRPAMSCRLSNGAVGKVPGPTLLRGARAAGLGRAWAGNWLWRRERMAMLVGGGGIEDASEAADTDEVGA